MDRKVALARDDTSMARTERGQDFGLMAGRVAPHNQ
jgi:hypothetical protein